MYMCVLENFMELGISMLPRTDNYTDVAAMSLQPLMEGVHSKEALDLVRFSLCWPSAGPWTARLRVSVHACTPACRAFTVIP